MERPKRFTHPETGGTFGFSETPDGPNGAGQTKYQGFWYRDEDIVGGKPRAGAVPCYSRYTPVGTLPRISLWRRLTAFWERWFTVP